MLVHMLTPMKPISAAVWFHATAHLRPVYSMVATLKSELDRGTNARYKASESAMAWNVLKVSSTNWCFLASPPQTA